MFNGVWGGSNLVPMVLSGLSGREFVVSFAIGAAAVNAALWAALALYLRAREEPLPQLHLRVMLLPGMVAGCCWAAGNFLSMLAVDALGEAIGNSCVQASIIVSGLWGIFYFREIQGRSVAHWFLGAFLALGGVALLAAR